MIARLEVGADERPDRARRGRSRARFDAAPSRRQRRPSSTPMRDSISIEDCQRLARGGVARIDARCASRNCSRASANLPDLREARAELHVAGRHRSAAGGSPSGTARSLRRGGLRPAAPRRAAAAADSASAPGPPTRARASTGSRPHRVAQQRLDAERQQRRAPARAGTSHAPAPCRRRCSPASPSQPMPPPAARNSPQLAR